MGKIQPEFDVADRREADPGGAVGFGVERFLAALHVVLPPVRLVKGPAVAEGEALVELQCLGMAHALRKGEWELFEAPAQGEALLERKAEPLLEMQ